MLLAVMILIECVILNLSLCALSVMHFCKLMILVKTPVGGVFTICKILKINSSDIFLFDRLVTDVIRFYLRHF